MTPPILSRLYSAFRSTPSDAEEATPEESASGGVDTTEDAPVETSDTESQQRSSDSASDTEDDPGFTFGSNTDSEGTDDDPDDPESDGDAPSGEEATAEPSASEAPLEELTEDELREHVEELQEEKQGLEQDVDSLREKTEELSESIERLEESKTDLEEENGRLRSALQREKQELEDYKERSKKREKQAREDAIRGLVEDLTDVRDTLQRALQQDEDMEVRDGVESTLRNFDRVMGDYNIDVIEPDPGTEPDAQRHEIMMKTDNTEIPEGAITDVFSAGYERDGRVFRPAQVVVSAGPPEETDEAGSDSSDSGTDTEADDGVADEMFETVEESDLNSPEADDDDEEFL